MEKILLALCMCFLPLPALAAPDGFTLVNETGVSIIGVFAGHANTSTWGPNVLSPAALESGSSEQINMDTTTNTFWDLRLIIQNGDSLQYGPYQLSNISEISVKSDGSALAK